MVKDGGKAFEDVRLRIGFKGNYQKIPMPEVGRIPLLPLGKGETFIEDFLEKRPDLGKGHHVVIMFFEGLSRGFHGQIFPFAFPALVHFFMCRIGGIGN